MSQSSPQPLSDNVPSAPGSVDLNDAIQTGPQGDGPIDPAKRRRSRLLLIAIVASFAIPLLLAILWLRVVQSGGAGELGDTSRGELIKPAVPFEAFSLLDIEGAALDLDEIRGLWTMLYLPAGDCAEVCQKNLYHMRQVRLALNHRMTRVQRVVVPQGALQLTDELIAEHPGLRVAAGSEADRAALGNQVTRAEKDMTPLPDAIYLVDPLGNVMMRFDPELEPGSMLKDIKHLLKNSKIG